MTLDEQDLLDMIADHVEAISLILFATAQVSYTENQRKTIANFLCDKTAEIVAALKKVKKINA